MSVTVYHTLTNTLFVHLYFNHYNQTFDIFTSDNAPLKIKKATNRYLMQQDESPDNPVSDTIEKNHLMQHQGSHSLLRGLAEDDEKVNICHYTSGSGYNQLSVSEEAAESHLSGHTMDGSCDSDDFYCDIDLFDDGQCGPNICSVIGSQDKATCNPGKFYQD